MVVVEEYHVTVRSLVGFDVGAVEMPRLLERRDGEAAFVLVCLAVCVDDGGAGEGPVMPPSSLPWL